MPKVGSKHFSYDSAGVEKAKRESERTGIPIEVEGGKGAGYGTGGKVRKKKKEKKKKKKEGPVERGRRLREERRLGEKSDRDEFYAQNPRSVLPSGSVSDGWDAGSEGHMSGILEPAAGRMGYKKGGKVRGAGAATKGLGFKG
jgi:hypothetical protein